MGGRRNAASWAKGNLNGSCNQHTVISKEAGQSAFIEKGGKSVCPPPASLVIELAGVVSG